jgi:hypothetical protein
MTSSPLELLIGLALVYVAAIALLTVGLPRWLADAEPPSSKRPEAAAPSRQ